MFRTAEAMLNYMEVCFEKNGALDDKAKGYWRALRTRAGIEPDFNVTVAATNSFKDGYTSLWVLLLIEQRKICPNDYAMRYPILKN